MWELLTTWFMIIQKIQVVQLMFFKLQGGDGQEGSLSPSEKTGCTVGIQTKTSHM